MSKRPRVLRSKRKIIGDLEVVNPNAAGIDAGSEEHWVSVPEDRSDQPVRSFGTFTADLQAAGRLAGGMPDHHGGYRSDRRVLDSAIRDSGGARAEPETGRLA